MNAWHASSYTGLFRRLGPLTPRPHDPRVALHAGIAASWNELAQSIDAGGVGWDAVAAEAACIGEAIERLQAYPLSDDRIVTASYESWPLDEPAVPPECWVLFHPEQYHEAGFPFQPFDRTTVCDWVCCREALTGAPRWAPAELVFLNQRPGRPHRLCPGISTGLAAGRIDDPLVLRGLQEVIERDAVVGAWWGRYALEEFAIGDVLEGLRPDARKRVLRPSLSFRCFQVVNPHSDFVSIVTLAGEDREGWGFSVGSACRETAAASWNKALLEAIHGRHYVRYLKQQVADGTLTLGVRPTTFGEHAVWYSQHSRDLERTPIGQAQPRGRTPFAEGRESVPMLAERLGPQRPILFRSLTPPTLAAEEVGWHVVRVFVPGLQPLHGNHAWAHLGGPLWAPRGLSDWQTMPPHPMP